MKTYRLTFGEVDETGKIAEPIYARLDLEDPVKDFWKLVKLMEAKIAVRAEEERNDAART